jgi:hypothetical protein
MRVILALGLLVLSTVAAAAQTSAAGRTPGGHHPDFQGIWANDTVTPLERPKRFADKEVLSEDEATEYEKDVIGRWRDKFGDLEITTSGELDDVWQEYGKVVPTRRTSLVVDQVEVEGERHRSRSGLGTATSGSRAPRGVWWCVLFSYVVSGFSRTRHGPPKG